METVVSVNASSNAERARWSAPDVHLDLVSGDGS